MLVDTFYRLFSHAALAFSCACLLEAEQQFLPAPEWAIPPVLVVIGLAFFLEGRWSLPDTAANVFAVLIAAGGVWWLVEQVYRPSGPVVLPLPTGLVPHLGPMIMALLLVKSFRPRRPADFWVLQGMGLLQVALACVLAADPHFGLLLAGYVVCGVTCLALRHAAGIERPDAERGTFPVAASRASFAVPVGPFLRRPFVWTPAIGILAGVLFLATPRGNWQSWDPLTRFGIRGSSFRASTGFAEEINLNGTGELELDDEVAFTVTAVDAANRPKTDLSPGTRWRGAVVENYRDGYWSSSDRARAGAALRRLRIAQEQLPSFGPAEYFLTFHVQPRRAGGLFLAEPILLGREPARLPVVGVDAAQPAPFYEFSGTVLPSNRVTRQEYVYRQVAAPVLVPDLVNAENLIFVEYARQLLAQPPERITAWTKERLQELARDNRYGLTAKDLDLDQTQKNDTGEPIPRSAERVARALCDYLALSGEFGYTLDQRREDLSADPAVDFLCNVHAGHCERYASGLTLMLRGCGIPARVVKGFRGAEHQADGVYVVRQSDAHAWVEALVPRPVSLTQAAQVSGAGRHAARQPVPRRRPRLRLGTGRLRLARPRPDADDRGAARAAVFPLAVVPEPVAADRRALAGNGARLQLGPAGRPLERPDRAARVRSGAASGADGRRGRRPPGVGGGVGPSPAAALVDAASGGAPTRSRAAAVAGPALRAARAAPRSRSRTRPHGGRRPRSRRQRSVPIPPPRRWPTYPGASSNSTTAPASGAARRTTRKIALWTRNCPAWKPHCARPSAHRDTMRVPSEEVIVLEPPASAVGFGQRRALMGLDDGFDADNPYHSVAMIYAGFLCAVAGPTVRASRTARVRRSSFRTASWLRRHNAAAGWRRIAIRLATIIWCCARRVPTPGAVRGRPERNAGADAGQGESTRRQSCSTALRSSPRSWLAAPAFAACEFPCRSSLARSPKAPPGMKYCKAIPI